MIKKDWVDEEASKKKRKIFHAVGGIFSILQLLGAAFLIPIRIVKTDGTFLQMTWNLQFSGTSVPNPNITYLEALSKTIGVNLSFLQPVEAYILPQYFIFAAVILFFIALPLRIFDVPIAPFIIGKIGSLLCLLVLVMVYAALSTSGALIFITTGSIDWLTTLSSSLGILLVFTGASTGLGA